MVPAQNRSSDPGEGGTAPGSGSRVFPGTNTYTAGTNYTVGTANVTLTAVWIATYIIAYDKNGATAGTAPALTSYVTGATGITLAAAGDFREQAPGQQAGAQVHAVGQAVIHTRQARAHDLGKDHRVHNDHR